jgi:DnaJ-class molecular chaperone
MAKNNRADGKKSSWHKNMTGRTCPTCGGSGSQVNSRGQHVDACRTCRGWGKVDN